MELRPAQHADAPTIARVFEAARAHSLPFLPVLHSPAENEAYFTKVVEHEVVTVSTAGGAVVAFLARNHDELDHLYVHPDHHGRGHGTALLTSAQAARDRLQLWVFQRNARAIAFYEAHGFAIVASTDGAGNEEREPDHRMAWSLG
jgi:ribosomal protein S18 acetylase RimI-like enzyme